VAVPTQLLTLVLLLLVHSVVDFDVVVVVGAVVSLLTWWWCRKCTGRSLYHALWQFRRSRWRLCGYGWKPLEVVWLYFAAVGSGVAVFCSRWKCCGYS